MFKTYTLAESERWDTLVKSFKDYEVYNLSGYTKAFQLHGDGTPLLFYYQDDFIRGMNVFMKREVNHLAHFRQELTREKYYDLTTPYGYGGFIAEGKVTPDNLNRLALTYYYYCLENNIINEFIRYNPLKNNHEQASELVDMMPLGETITIDLTSPEEIWTNFKGNNRRNIKKASSAGIEIHFSRGPELYDTFQYIYNSTMQRNEASNYYFFEPNFYQSLREDLPDNHLIFYAELDGQIISMAIILFANQSMHYHLSGNLYEYNHLRPSNLMLYKAALWGYDQGFHKFHLGGGLGSGEDDLLRFKSSFNKKSSTRFVIGKQIFLEDTYNQLVELRAKSPDFNRETTFFPKYRA